MATEKEQVVTDSKVASGTIAKYVFAKLSSGELATAGAADRAYGVTQEALTVGKTGLVCVVGITKIQAGGTIAAGAAIGPDASGKAVAKTTSGDLVHGIARVAMVDGDIGSAIVNCANAAQLN